MMKHPNRSILTIGWCQSVNVPKEPDNENDQKAPPQVVVVAGTTRRPPSHAAWIVVRIPVVLVVVVVVVYQPAHGRNTHERMGQTMAPCFADRGQNEVELGVRYSTYTIWFV